MYGEDNWSPELEQMVQELEDWLHNKRVSRGVAGGALLVMMVAMMGVEDLVEGSRELARRLDEFATKGAALVRRRALH